MGRLRCSRHMAALAQKAAANGVGRDKDGRRLGMKNGLAAVRKEAENPFSEFPDSQNRNWTFYRRCFLHCSYFVYSEGRIYS